MRRGQLYDYKGEQLTLREIEARCGINRHTLYNRMVDRGMTMEEAVAMPKNAPGLHLYCGEMMSLKQIGEIVHIPAGTLSARMRRYGISAQDAADGNFATWRYAYEGKQLSINRIAQMADVDAEELRRILYNQHVTPEEAVERLRNQDGEAGRPKKHAGDVRADIAARLIGAIVNGLDVKRQKDGSYAGESRLYRFSVRFPTRDGAELIASWKKTGCASMIRRYAIDGERVTQIEAVSL